ncbi:hypothetical protein BBAD15_g12485 [Beauveria bassiana D1-5]|uniref:Uncharacterized protein n=1 Tax=Beauveria bassiana D1-5 TaxID=1245745 RepID=A0A0A2V7K9_BEABA|nr:hypothetical protein BBAD15_g12485 [Beauveria bassiana D1-5]
MTHAAGDGAAQRLDRLGRVGLERVAEGVVDGDEVPGLAARLDRGLGAAGGLRIGVEHPVEADRRAFLVGQRRGGRAREHHDLVLFARDALHRQRHRGIGQVGDGGDAVAVEPFARLGRAHVGLVLVVGRHQLDLHALALGRQAIVDGQLRRRHRTGSAHAGIGARHVRQDADLHWRFIRRVRLTHQCCAQTQACGQPACVQFHGFVS